MHRATDTGFQQVDVRTIGLDAAERFVVRAGRGWPLPWWTRVQTAPGVTERAGIGDTRSNRQ